MEIVLDFTRSAGGPAAAPGPDQAEQLLACFQKALGHELPNQLVAIQGLARLLEGESGLGPEGRALVGRLVDLTRRADGLVRALADLGRLCRERAPGPPLAPADVAREAAAAVNFVSPEVAIEYDLENALPHLTVPRRALYQVLLHLLHNAVQSAAPGRPLRVALGGSHGPEGVSFWVADNGRGLDDAQVGQVFDPFPGGAAGEDGLGLFLVRLVVAGWGGTVRAASEPGKGTRLTVLVPPRWCAKERMKDEG
jgi:two-component system sensor histidine kinase HydH